MNKIRNCLAATICLAVFAEAIAAQWRVTALTPEYILVQADGSQDENKAFFADERCRNIDPKLQDWQVRRLYAAIQNDVEKAVRAPLAESIKKIPGFMSYWPEANGVKRVKGADGKEFSFKSADMIHNAFVKVKPMVKGDKIDLGVAGKFVYDPQRPTPVFKVNQVGYQPNARKYAYVGGWLGLSGALPLAKFDGKPFAVYSAKTGAKVYGGSLKARGEDPKRNGTPFTGEEVLEIDLTPFTAEGEYYIAVDGIGRSSTFKVSKNAIVEAWGHHMLGLFNKRCGIEKKEPYTKWPAEACHLNVYRGVQPSDDWHYGKYIFPADSKPILTNDGKPFRFTHFPVIAASKCLCDMENPIHIPGGYHDAADYDRRPMHLVIPRALAMVYLLKPENFTDGQLLIPESKNGIPDILDEALWGIRHLIKAQQADGGVGTWIETRCHPGGEAASPAQDSTNLTYFIARPTHNSCYDFAGTAALVARAYRAAGKNDVARRLQERAIRAWNWAEKNPPVVQKMKCFVTRRWDKDPPADVEYREPEDYSVKLMLTAALNLSALTGDMTYFKPVVARLKDLQTETNKGSWGWNPIDLLELGLKGQPLPAELEDYRKGFIRRRVGEADALLKTMENSYPYRIFWFPPDHGFVHTMSWGNSHPLRRAQFLLAAHVFTGETRYLEGIYLANDFHNGANPKGETLTSGMGEVFPVKFLDLQSISDNVAEFVGGITPYRWTYGVNFDAKKMVYGESNIPSWPIWRRFANIEQYSVAASEYTVWETMLPPAAVLAYILPGPEKVPARVYTREPASDLRDLPGYWVKP